MAEENELSLEDIDEAGEDTHVKGEGKTGRPKKGKDDGLKEQFLIWCGLPVPARAADEKDQEAWRHKYHVSKPTLSAWKKDPAGKRIMASAFKALGGNEMPEVVQALIRKCKEGNPQALRLYLEWQGEVGTQRVRGDKPSEITVTYKTKE